MSSTRYYDNVDLDLPVTAVVVIFQDWQSNEMELMNCEVISEGVEIKNSRPR